MVVTSRSLCWQLLLIVIAAVLAVSLGEDDKTTMVPAPTTTAAPVTTTHAPTTTAAPVTSEAPGSKCPEGCSCDNATMTVKCDNFTGKLSDVATGDVISLFITHAKIAKISKDDLKDATSLKEFTLAFSDLADIEAGSFDTVTSLEKLNMSTNKLAIIPDNLFKNLGSLTNLVLYQNQLAKITNATFAGLTSLADLCMCHNQINSTDPTAFSDLKNLMKLSAIGNKLTEIKAKTFDNNVHMTELILSQNQIISFNASITALENLENVDLSNNNLTSVPAGIFPKAVKMELDLTLNKITSFDKKALDGVSMSRLVLNNNPLNTIKSGSFDNAAITVLEMAGMPRLQTIEDDAFKGLAGTTEIHMMNNPKLSSLGNNTLGGFDQLIKLFLGNCNFAEVPSSANFTQLSALTLDLNKITTVKDNTFSKAVNLNELSLCNVTGLTTVEPAAFKGMGKLITLMMKNNKDLTSIPQDSFSDVLETADLSSNAITKFGSKFFSSSVLTDANIENNPLRCDCNATWIKDKMNDPTVAWIQPWRSYLTCASPASLQDQKVSELLQYDLTCDKTSIVNNTKIVMAGYTNIYLQAMLSPGRPTVVWTLPDNTTVIPDAPPTSDKTNATAHNQVLADGNVTASLTVLVPPIPPQNDSKNGSQPVVYGNYTLTATNAAGESNFTFKAPVPGPTPPKPSGGSGSSNTALLAAIGVLAALLLIFIVGFVLIYRKYKRMNRYGALQEE